MVAWSKSSFRSLSGPGGQGFESRQLKHFSSPTLTHWMCEQYCEEGDESARERIAMGELKKYRRMY